MIELLRLQLLQMLGGKRKWLVAICLLLPVLLTLLAVTSGGWATCSGSSRRSGRWRPWPPATCRPRHTGSPGRARTSTSSTARWC